MMQSHTYHEIQEAARLTKSARDSIHLASKLLAKHRNAPSEKALKAALREIDLTVPILDNWLQRNYEDPQTSLV